MLKIISSRDLNSLFSMAKTFHNSEAHRGLEQNEITAKCWLLAVSQYLDLKEDYRFPDYRKIAEPDDEV